MTDPSLTIAWLIAQEAEKAARDNGFRLAIPQGGRWHAFASTTASGHLWLTADAVAGPWTVAIDHTGVVAALDAKPDPTVPGPGAARYRRSTLAALYPLLAEIYRLASSLPDFPLAAFEQQTASLPKSTEAERLTIQRVGQDIFRAALMNYWQGTCPMTGITDAALLRASHIVPWAQCQSDAQRLDVHNGLLLSSLWDAAFDAGLVSFNDDGQVLISPKLTDRASSTLGMESCPRLLGLTASHRSNLKWHRARFEFRDEVA